MRLFVQFRLDSPLTMPINYQQVLQGFIYNHIEDKKFARFLHDQGYKFENRRFKLFTFSRLSGSAAIDQSKKTITFTEQVRWQVSSCLPKFIQQLGQSLLVKESLQLNRQTVHIEEIRYIPLSIHEEICTVRMLSPITIHSTYISRDGLKTTQFFSPFDPAFTHLINENLSKKYFAYFGESMKGKIEIKPIRVNARDKVITRFKDFIIEAWGGVYELHGEPETLTFACSVGLGGRNSSGFGMPELLSIPRR